MNIDTFILKTFPPFLFTSVCINIKLFDFETHPEKTSHLHFFMCTHKSVHNPDKLLYLLANISEPSVDRQIKKLPEPTTYFDVW